MQDADGRFACELRGSICGGREKSPTGARPGSKAGEQGQQQEAAAAARGSSSTGHGSKPSSVVRAPLPSHLCHASHGVFSVPAPIVVAVAANNNSLPLRVGVAIVVPPPLRYRVIRAVQHVPLLAECLTYLGAAHAWTTLHWAIVKDVAAELPALFRPFRLVGLIAHVVVAHNVVHLPVIDGWR